MDNNRSGAGRVVAVDNFDTDFVEVGFLQAAAAGSDVVGESGEAFERRFAVPGRVVIVKIPTERLALHRVVLFILNYESSERLVLCYSERCCDDFEKSITFFFTYLHVKIFRLRVVCARFESGTSRALLPCFPVTNDVYKFLFVHKTQL